MLEMRNFLQKKINKKGFTLAELLVVVAIIAILVAVSIPIFTGKLNDAKKSTDDANARAAKAVVATAILQKDVDLSKTVYYEYDAANDTIKAPSENDIQTGTVKGYGKYKKGNVDNVDKVIVVTVAPPATEEGNPAISIKWVPGTK